MTALILVLLLARPDHIPPIARIMGVRVGYNGRARLERAFGEGEYSVGGHPNSMETWHFSHPRSELTTDGFSYTEHEDQLLEGPTWSTNEEGFVGRHKGTVPKTKGWLRKIVLGMPKKEALQIATQMLGKPDAKDGEYTWTQKGWSYPYDLNAQNPFDTWHGSMSFENGKVSHIEVHADETTKGGPYPQFRKDQGKPVDPMYLKDLSKAVKGK